MWLSDMINYRDCIELREVPKPDFGYYPEQVVLTDETMEERLNKVIASMKTKGLDLLLVYADLEHGSNFEYLTGFLPRFEEAVLVLHQDKTAYLLLLSSNQ